MEHNLINIPFLGNGIGYRNELRSYIFLNRDKIDFVEIIAEHFMDVPDSRLEELELLKSHFTVIPHAINLSLGSSKGVDMNYVRKLGELIRFIQPPYWSEHISYTQAHDYDAGHLSPIIYNRQFLQVMEKNIGRVKEQIDCPLILENITYHVDLPGREFNDADFLNTLCEKTNCGLLLDLTNLLINSKNFDFDPFAFITQTEAENIVQLHYVGYDEGGGQYIDTHERKTQNNIFELMEYVLNRRLPKGILLERDGNFDKLDEITADLLHVKEFIQKGTNASR